METSLLSSPGGNLSAEAHQCSVCQSVNLVGAFRVKQREYLRCSRCGLIFVKRINPEDEKAKYEDGPYYQLFESMQRLELKQAVFERSLREIARIRQPGRLLDVGCGNGLFLNCARRHGWETYGAELSPQACAHARQAFGLNVFHGDLREGHFADSFFDVVTLYDVLCHVPSPLDQLMEIHRILKVGGFLILRVRNAVFHVGLVRLLQSLEPYLVFHLYCFTPMAIRFLLGKAGYTRLRVRNSVLTANDPYFISPLFGDTGMQAIKKGVYVTAEVVSHLSGHALLLGPSLEVHAMKREGAGAMHLRDLDAIRVSDS